MHTNLAEYLRNQGVTQVVIVGVSTSSGVESTARQAYEHGFNVTLAVDAMTDPNPDTHVNSITRIFPQTGSETGTTQEDYRSLPSTKGAPDDGMGPLRILVFLRRCTSVCSPTPSRILSAA